MEKYHFYFYRKCTTWCHTPFDVYANSQEEAIQKATEMYLSGEISNYSWDYIDDTTESMSPSENEGQPTEELMFDGSIIKTN